MAKRMKRTKIIKLRASDAEYAYIRNRAADAGMSVTTFLRSHIGCVPAVGHIDKRNKMIMLNRIHSNLCALADWVKTYKGKAVVVQVLAHLVLLERAILQMANKDEVIW